MSRLAWPLALASIFAGFIADESPSGKPTKPPLDDESYLRALTRFETRAMWIAGAVVVAALLWWLVR